MIDLLEYILNESKKIYLGYCKDEGLIEDIFGSVSEFARQVEEHGNEFIYEDSIQVVYDNKTDIHHFWKII